VFEQVDALVSFSLEKLLWASRGLVGRKNPIKPTDHHHPVAPVDLLFAQFPAHQTHRLHPVAQEDLLLLLRRGLVFHQSFNYLLVFST